MGITSNTGLSHVTRHRRLSTRLEEETYVRTAGSGQLDPPRTWLSVVSG